MEQIKISLKKEQIEFIQNHSKFGFKDRSSLIRKAVEVLKENIESDNLRASAKILSEIYSNDDRTKDWIKDSNKSWPDDN